jgi:two-component system CheB/CheR fusion protein
VEETWNSSWETSLGTLLRILAREIGVDFRRYRRGGTLRGIESRMYQKHVETLKRYVRLLKQDPAELQKLYERILVKTTAFYRDPAAWNALQDKVLVPLIRSHFLVAPLRFWVVGCSTGEEAYSLAMAVEDSGDRLNMPVPFQILASDISLAALLKARAGQYSERLVAGVPLQYRERFFVKDGGSFRISALLRRRCIFTEHNLVDSIPFSRMDLITCRNVLIYMDAGLQRVALARLHYALQPGGYLMLGSSETIQGQPGWMLVDRPHRIFQRVP